MSFRVMAQYLTSHHQQMQGRVQSEKLENVGMP